MTIRSDSPLPLLPSYLELCAPLPHSKELDGDGRFIVAPLTENPHSQACLDRLSLIERVSRADEEGIQEWKRILSNLHVQSGPKALKTLMHFSESLPDWFANTPSIHAILKTAKKNLARSSEWIIGTAPLTKIDTGTILPCLITRTFGYSKEIDQIVTVFNVYLKQTGERLGRCRVNILRSYSDCDNKEYCSRPVAAIVRIDSFARKTIRGIGKTLMQTVMEAGMREGTQGRVALHSEGPALGFYYKLGMKPTYPNPTIENAIREELRRASEEHREPVDLLEGNALSMILPPAEIIKWAKIIRTNPVLTLC